jgi:hypothetical protein
MGTQSTGDLLAGRFQQFRQQQEQVKLSSSSSIENTVGKPTSSSSIETKAVDNTLPTAITELITGNDYWVLAKSNRYRKLIREGHLEKLLDLAKMAQTKNNPANWFAKACSKAAWERTLAYFAKLSQVARKAETVAKRLGTTTSKFIYKQIWKGVNVERWAIQAQEMKHEKPGQNTLKHFAWLCVHEKQLLQAR